MDKTRQKFNIRRIRLTTIFFLSFLLVFISSCGSLPANNASVKIKTPPTGLSAGDVTISVDVSNFEFANANDNQKGSEKGHIIYYLDALVPTYYSHLAISKTGTYAIATEYSYTWENVPPGEHTFSVQLVKADDTPLVKAVTDSLTINVGPPMGNPEIAISTPLDGSSITPGDIVIELIVNNFVISKNDMGVVNRKGEGHLIYYLDEDAPVIQGTPALTETSMVTTKTRILFRNVKEGKHKIAVQLVNNDDTPLESPVVKVISIDVAP